MKVASPARGLAAWIVLLLATNAVLAAPPQRIIEVRKAGFAAESPQEPIAPRPEQVADESLWQGSGAASNGGVGCADVGCAIGGGCQLDGCDSGCEDCCQYCWNGGCCRKGVWYAGGDYLLVRPTFSQNVAYYICATATDTASDPVLSVASATAVQFPYQYRSAYRAFIGYHLWDCGGDILFTYWNLQDSANIVGGPASTSDEASVLFCGQFGNMAATAGQFLAASSEVRADIYDLDFAKSINLGGAGPCCTSCPRWDLRWSAGVRGAQVSRTDNNEVINPDQSAAAIGQSRATFTGAGPRVGLQGRRYLGSCGYWSLYARTNMSLLLGTYNQTRTAIVEGSEEVPTTFTTQTDNFRRMVPVTDIEVGGTWQVTPRLFFSAGWLFQCWWDLGFGETQESVAFTPLDTSNIMAWDGLFLKGELIF
jgi:hypothetical protein